MRPLLRLTILLFILMIPWTSSALASMNPGTGEKDLMLFYSNDVLGETEPCG